MNIECRVTGIDCASCALEIEEEINKIDEVESATLNFLTQKLDVEIIKGADNDLIIEKITKIVKNHEPDASIEEI